MKGQFEDPGPAKINIVYHKGLWAYIGEAFIESVTAETTSEDCATATYNFNGMGGLIKMFRPKFWIYHNVFRMSPEEILKRRKK